MRVKVNKDKGNPSLRGIELRPSGGYYEVSDEDGRLLVETHGFASPDYAPKQRAHPLRAAIVRALAGFGVSISIQAPDDALIKALDGLPDTVAQATAASAPPSPPATPAAPATASKA